MNKLFKFLSALLIFISMYKKGFYFTKAALKSSRSGLSWGSYILNFREEKDILKIDFNFDRKFFGVYEIHGENFKFFPEKNGLAIKYKVRSRL